MNWQEEMEAEYDARFGDPRRCPTHGTVTSDPFGLFDAPCGACEGESEQAEWEADHPEEVAAHRAARPRTPRQLAGDEADTPF